MSQNISQIKAADPETSVWVSASAGTGKTKVLTDRVLRLLLSEVPLEKILCLTFTNAAASEMKTRIIEALQKWQDNPSKLEELLQRKPLREEIEIAKGLFAKLLLSPEQLAINTIHSFCQKILQKFPFEAGLQPSFKVLSEMEMKELSSKLIKDISVELNGAMLNKESFEFVLRNVHQLSFNDLIMEIISNQINFRDLFDHYESVDNYKAYLMEWAGIYKSQTDYIKELISKLRPLPSIPDDLQENEMEIIERYQSFLRSENKIKKFTTLIDSFYTKLGIPRKKLLTKKHLEKYPELGNNMLEMQALVVEYYEYIKKARMVEATIHIYKVAEYILSKYNHYKHKLIALDYDDLIYYAKKLLWNSKMHDWVLYKLDGGISHLLIDEAQDTSPKQWQIIEAIMREFYAGDSAYNEDRTVFVVGDEKQSIYSFQGADVSNFSRVSHYIHSQMNAADKPYQNIELEWVYRSAPEILNLVSETFKDSYLKNIELKCFRGDAKGEVELWPITYRHPEGVSTEQKQSACDRRDPRIGDEKTELAHVMPPEVLTVRSSSPSQDDGLEHPQLQSQGPDGRSKLLPQDDVGSKNPSLFWPSVEEMEEEESPSKQLAKQIAYYIRDYIDSGKIMPSTGKPACAGDFMILIRRRNEFTDEIISELKESGISVAGIDRMLILDHLSAQDIIAAAKFALLPEDDLNLASLLKSPLIGMKDKEIADIAISRKESLYTSLPRMELLENLIDMCTKLTAFDFLHNLIDVMGARAILTRYNGLDSDDVLDELLNICISWSKIGGTNLQGFISWIEKNEVEIKRDIESRDNVRVMTVHASKGLESPVVILPDTTKSPKAQNHFLWKDGNFLWLGGSKNSNELYAEYKQDREARDYQEYMRLLYVAMTRAEDHLIVCGYQARSKIDEKCWYSVVEKVLGSRKENDIALHPSVSFSGAAPTVTPAFEPGHGNKFMAGSPIKLRVTMAGSRIQSGMTDTQDDVSLKLHSIRMTEYENKPNYVRSPLDKRMDISYGIVLHKVLEDSVKLGEFTLDKKHPYLSKLPERLQNHIMKKLPKLFQEKEFTDILAYPNVQTEVSMGYIEDDRFKFGRIDLLAMSDKKAVIIDYKSESEPPKEVKNVPDLYIKQLTFYAEFIKKAYPNLSATSKILWLENFSMMEICRID